MEKKPFYKRWWFITITVILLIGILGTIFESDEAKQEREEKYEQQEKERAEAKKKREEERRIKKQEKEAEKQMKAEKKKNEKKEREKEKKAKEEEKKAKAEEEKEIKEFKKKYGSPSNVRNDKKGHWRKIVTSRPFDAEKDTLSYYDIYMEDGQVHYIVSFATNTTTVIRDVGDWLNVTVHEYEDKEEHDANTIGNGMQLAEYNVFFDGEVKEVK